MIYKKLEDKECSISVIGLGYVGLPIALEFARKFKVIGFDINEKRVEQMRNHIDPSKELSAGAFEGTDIQFTSNLDDLKEASFHIVAVPTPIDKKNQPDLTPLLKASETVGKVVKKGDYIIFESTVYPGATEEDCIPLIEKTSGLKFQQDFKVGYSPERINPGDTVHTLTNVVKVVSGSDAESLEEIARTYETIITAGVHRAASIKVAEAAKVIENTQRDVNIALINELSIIFNKMNINTFDVLKAAQTKWNFLPFSPGLVGGHCIGVDPYYLTFKAKEYGYHAQIINSGRSVNDGMGAYIAGRIVKKIVSIKNSSDGAKVLVMGATFKENVSDIRNSKVADVVNELKAFGLQVDITDPHASSSELKNHYGFGLTDELADDYDAIVIAVKHEEYLKLDEKYFKKISNPNAFIFDVKGNFREQIKAMDYLSL